MSAFAQKQTLELRGITLLIPTLKGGKGGLFGSECALDAVE